MRLLYRGIRPCNSCLCIHFVFQFTQGVSAESTITVQIPSALKQAAKKTSNVVCTFFKNNSLFQVRTPPPHSKKTKHHLYRNAKKLGILYLNTFVFQETVKNARLLDDVVGITVENEVITNLPEPIRIDFHHDVIPVSLCAFLCPFVCISVISFNLILSNATLSNVDV